MKTLTGESKGAPDFTHRGRGVTASVNVQGSHGRFYSYLTRRCPILVLNRTLNQEIMIGDNIRVMVIEIRGDKVRLGITAPRDVPVHRHEVYEAIKREADANDSDCD